MVFELNAFDIIIKKAGWNLPKKKGFIFVKKNNCKFIWAKSCTYRLYRPKKNIYLNLKDYYSLKKYRTKDILRKNITIIDILVIEKLDKIKIDEMVIYHYKSKPFMIELRTNLNIKNKIREFYPYYFIDMDMNGTYETYVLRVFGLKYFFKFSSIVEEKDKFKGKIIFGNKEIK